MKRETDLLKLSNEKITMASCAICFCPIESQSIICADPFCSAQVCAECAALLIEYSERERVIPKCPSQSCSSYFLLDQIRTLDDKMVALYQSACLKNLIKEKGTAVKKNLQHKEILERLREERKEYIDTHFPAAISHVAGIAFASKLRRLEKRKAEALTQKINAAHRTCMNLFCKGHLDNNLVCMTCSTQFCVKCERKITPDHVCKPEDIKSIDFIKTLVTCPKCKLPVQKSEGCNSITCAHCGTLFDYATGEHGGHGSDVVPVKSAEERRLTDGYSEALTSRQLKLLLEIEAQRPQEPSEIPIVNALKYWYKTKNAKKSAQKVAEALETFAKRQYAAKRYQQVLGNIEEMLQKNEQSRKKLEQINEELQNI